MDANKLRAGHKILLDDAPFEVIEYTLRQQPRLATKMITKLKNLLTGATVEKTFTSGENLKEAEVDYKRAEFLYEAGGSYSFMDNESYEQFDFSTDILGEKTKYLMEGMEISIAFWEDTPLSIQLPGTVEMEITETEPGVRGDTVSGGTKPATTETGLVIKVPLFITAGERVIVNTETGEYKERAK